MADPITALLVFFLAVAVVATIWWAWSRRSLWRSKPEEEKTLIEDVLKQLYHVEYAGDSASLNDMAGALRLSQRKLVSVIEMATDQELIRMEDGKLHLTEHGRNYALKIVRVHRLWEKYLSEKTGFDKREWHDRAEQMEHLLTAKQTEALDDELGNPRFDPHGDPIPTSKGEVVHVPWVQLSALAPNTPAKILHIEDEPAAIYEQILEKKLHIGAHLKVLSADDKGLTIHSEGEEFSLTPIVAANVSVLELSEQDKFEENAVRLTDLKDGETAKVLGLSQECRGATRRRLLDLGFIPGTEIHPEISSPMKDPRAYMLRNTLIALRNDQADLVIIEKEHEDDR